MRQENVINQSTRTAPPNEITKIRLFHFCSTAQPANWEIGSEWTQGTNVLGLVMFSVVLGVTIGKLKEKGKPLQVFFVALSEAMMQITSWVIW